MRYFSFILLVLGLISCQEQEALSDAYGNFTAHPVLISAEAQGKLMLLDAEEGQVVQAGALLALVDTTALHLQKQLIEAQIGVLPQKFKHALSEIEVLKRQKSNLEREKARLERLLVDRAATPQQLEQMTGEIEVLAQKMVALQTQTQIANRAILAEEQPLLAQLEIVKDQIRRCFIYSPFTGTVLTKVAEPAELVQPGKPLLRMANLDTMRLQFYVSGIQLQALKLGQEVEVLIDGEGGELRALSGRISYLAAEAEFTPSTIQTREERVHLVYAVEARVANPAGRLKIGMPAEVNF